MKHFLQCAIFIGICTLVLAFVYASGKRSRRDVEERRFPDDFLFGAATSAYQVEGAWNEGGKSENIWDRLARTRPNAVLGGTNGDVAADSYHRYERDVEMIRELGLDTYRFSLSWSRILPSGFAEQIGEEGVAYYNNLINELLRYNIQPMVTLYHLDLPQRLQDLGGWTNPLIVDWFGDYAKVAYGLFGDRVKYWITINEPKEICLQGYGDATKAPLLSISGVAEYMCAKNVLLAHARAWRIYDGGFRRADGGDAIGLVLSAQWYEPESEEHVTHAEEYRQFEWGQYAHPVFTEAGDFPQAMKDKIAAKSLEQGFPRSRLPELSQSEIDYIKGTSDFFGINHYTTFLVYRNSSVEGIHRSPSYLDDIGAVRYQPNDWEQSNVWWLKVVPWGFEKILMKIQEDYGSPPVLVTANGYASGPGLVDTARVQQLRSYLDVLLDAMRAGVDVRGYVAWSLMDNFDWTFGYTQRFGLYEVDFSSPERTRTPRTSALVYRHVVRTRAVDHGYQPAGDGMTVDNAHL